MKQIDNTGFIMILILIISILVTVLVKIAEKIFGISNVLLFSFITVLVSMIYFQIRLWK